MTETLNEIWTNAENLAKLVANAYIAYANNKEFKMNKDWYMAVFSNLTLKRDKSVFIGKITKIIDLFKDKEEIKKIVKYIYDLPDEEVKGSVSKECPEYSYGYFQVTFKFLLKCEEVEKRIKENVG